MRKYFGRDTLRSCAKIFVVNYEKTGTVPEGGIQALLPSIHHHLPTVRAEWCEDSDVHHANFAQADDIQIMNWVIEFF